MLKYITRSIFVSRGSRTFSVFRQNLCIYTQVQTARVNCRPASATHLGVQFPNSLRTFCSDSFIEAKDVFDDEEYKVEELADISPEKSTKDILYRLSDDPIISELNNCQSTDEVFKFFEESGDTFNEKHLTQTVIVLWALVKDQTFNRDQRVFTITELKTPSFQKLLDRLDMHVEQMSPGELTCNLLYLQRMGLGIKSVLSLNLIEQFLQLVKTTEIPLAPLSRFIIALSSDKGLYAKLAYMPPTTILVDKIKKSRTSEDIKLLTTCLNHFHNATPDILYQLYREKIQEMLTAGDLQLFNNKCILKIINFLNYPYWSQRNIVLVRQLTMLLYDRIPSFDVTELVAIHKVLEQQLEPAFLISAVAARSQQLLETQQTAELLSCLPLYNQSEKRVEVTKMIQKLLSANDDSIESSIPSMFKAIRYLKISNFDMIDDYWNHVVKLITTSEYEKQTHRLLRHCRRYMFFNNNLGGTYRHHEFEGSMIKMILKDLAENISTLVPSKFARTTSFVLAYGYMPEALMCKFEDMSEQFTLHDVLFISRGIKIANELRFRSQKSQKTAANFWHISKVIEDCIERVLATSTFLSLDNINFIIRTLNNLKSSHATPIFMSLTEKLNNCESPLNSRNIRETAYNLIASKSYVPNMQDKFLDYVDNNEDFVSGETVQKILYSGFKSGYMPENRDHILKKCSDIVIRDFSFMTGLSIIQACLSLCFYKALPERLINLVFNIDFIRHLELEIQMCYSKATYPGRISTQVMKLNRAVCLDFPEAQVPWFQQNFVEAQMSRMPTIRNTFYNDCKQLLLSVVSDEQLIRFDHVTPYGYKIDFVLHIDNVQKKFTKPPKEGSLLHNINKIGVLLLQQDAFCDNDAGFMKGSVCLRQRHLEILGYNVVHINYNDWNAMYMSVPGAKENYLKDRLKIS